MKPFHLALTTLVAAATVTWAADPPLQRRSSLPSPPPPVSGDSTGPREPLSFDRSAPKELNARKRAAIEARMSELAAKISEIDGRAIGRPLREGVVPPGSPASATPAPAGRPALAKELGSWEKFLAAFDLESICGPVDRSQDVEMYDGNGGPTREFVSLHQPAVAQIQWVDDIAQRLGAGGDPGNVAGVRWCSGTLISPSRFLTAGHCVEVHTDDGWVTPTMKGTSLAPGRLAPLMRLNFNYQVDPATGNPRAATTYPVVKLLEHAKGGLDYAVLEVGPNQSGELPSKRFPPAKMVTSKAALMAAKMLTVIQHPNGVPKRIAGGVGVGLASSSITYSDVDTLGGSSGSGVLDQDGNVIAVHNLGGCSVNGGSNSGVTLSAISKVSAFVK